ncbi:MAG: hypothetical protein WDM70_01270 [Nitrosomonadales bacterium]
MSASALQGGEVAALLKKLSGVTATLFDDNLFTDVSELKTPSGILA